MISIYKLNVMMKTLSNKRISYRLQSGFGQLHKNEIKEKRQESQKYSDVQKSRNGKSGNKTGSCLRSVRCIRYQPGGLLRTGSQQGMSSFSMSAQFVISMQHTGFDHQEEIHPMSQKNKDRSNDQRSFFAFRIISKQDKKRYHKIDDQIAVKQYRIIVSLIVEIDRLFPHVAVPDQHILRKPQVRPEDTKSKQKLAKVVKMFHADIWKISNRTQVQQRQDCEGYHRDKPARGRIPGEQRTIPVSVHRHHPQPDNHG